MFIFFPSLAEISSTVYCGFQIPEPINTSPQPNPSVWQRYAKLFCTILFIKMENRGDKEPRKSFQLISPWCKSPELDTQRGQAGQEPTHSPRTVPVPGDASQMPSGETQAPHFPPWGQKDRHSKLLCWRFGKKKGGKPFLIPPFCGEWGQPVWELHHLCSSRALQLLSREREREATPGLCTLRSLSQGWGEIPFLFPALGCKSCKRCSAGPWTTFISATELGRKQIN